MNIFLSNLALVLMSLVVFLMLLTVIVNLFIRVPFVPSKKRVISRVLDLAKLKDGEKVYDLGCGDGRFLIEAEKRAKIIATGFEAAPIPLLMAYLFKWVSRAKFRISTGNFFKADLSPADVIFCYLGPETMADLAGKFKKECRKGTRIYSHTFHMEGMTPAKVWARDKAIKMPTIYLYEIS
jgi:hypothetical protein